jgi:hypothetical protein
MKQAEMEKTNPKKKIISIYELNPPPLSFTLFSYSAPIIPKVDQ